MKNKVKAISISLGAFLFLAITSCQDVYETYEVIEENILIGATFEIEGSFVAPNFIFGMDFPYELYQGDAVLCYILWGVDSEGQDVWRPLPQYAEVGGVGFQYNYEYTVSYVNVFIDGVVPNDTSYTNNQVFRIVVMPADIVSQYQEETLKTMSYDQAVKIAKLQDKAPIKQTIKRNP